MINNIETTITALSTFPDRPKYTSARDYATAVATWLRENKELSQALATLIPELNLIIEQLNTTTENIETIEENIEQIANVVLNLRNEALAFKNLAQKYATENEDVEVATGEFSAKHWALKAYTAVATLPLGTLIDTLIGLDKTWSSTKIKSELDLKADKNSTYTKEDVDTNFQEKLISGTNIKKINNQDIIGEGNISTIIVPEWDEVGCYTIAGIRLDRGGALEIGAIVSGSRLTTHQVDIAENSSVLGGGYVTSTEKVFDPSGISPLGTTGSWRVLTRIKNNNMGPSAKSFLALVVKIA